jgi:hypothetical protein
MKEGGQKISCNSLIKIHSFSQKIKLGTLKTSEARFLEVPKTTKGVTQG